jgi:hypothetical protein
VKTAKPALLNPGHADDVQTPPEALLPLLPYLPPRRRIWECAAGSGSLARELERHGHHVTSTDLLTGEDFLTYVPSWPFDTIVTNPPYGLKTAFLARAYTFGQPFAFLLPLTALEGKARQSLYRAHGLEVILFPERVTFIMPNKQGSPWFQVAWFTHGLGIGRQLTFWQVQP